MLTDVIVITLITLLQEMESETVTRQIDRSHVRGLSTGSMIIQ